MQIFSPQLHPKATGTTTPSESPYSHTHFHLTGCVWCKLVVSDWLWWLLFSDFSLREKPVQRSSIIPLRMKNQVRERERCLNTLTYSAGQIVYTSWTLFPFFCYITTTQCFIKVWCDRPTQNISYLWRWSTRFSSLMDKILKVWFAFVSSPLYSETLGGDQVLPSCVKSQSSWIKWSCMGFNLKIKANCEAGIRVICNFWFLNFFFGKKTKKYYIKKLSILPLYFKVLIVLFSI